jgi:hypothetical protein
MMNWPFGAALMGWLEKRLRDREYLASSQCASTGFCTLDFLREQSMVGKVITVSIIKNTPKTLTSLTI